MELLNIGLAINIFGIAGDLKIKPTSDFSALRYKKGKKILLRNEVTNQEIYFTVERYRNHNGLDLVKFNELKDGTMATKYIGWFLLDEKEAIKLPKDAYFFSDLVGCVVISETNEEIGKVIKVETYTAQNTLRIFREEKADLLVPFVDFFIKKVDISNRSITIHVIEGML
jgi:16S rRNA processing protein RimM